MRKQATQFIVLSAIAGFSLGFLTRLFIYLLQHTTSYIWHTIVPGLGTSKWWVVCITVIGGLLLGLCVKYFGTNEGLGFEAVVVAAKRDGDLGFNQILRVVVNSFVGLVTGASIGPEAPLVTIAGWAGTMVAKILKLSKEQVQAVMYISFGGGLGVLLSSPIVGPIMVAESPPTNDKKTNNLFIFGSMVAASVGFAIFYALNGPLISGLAIVPAYKEFHSVELLYGLVLGVVGAFVGLLTKKSIIKTKAWAGKLKKFPVARGAAAGLMIGIIGVWLPLTMFDGSNQLHQLVTHTASYSIAMLLLLVVARTVAMSIAFGAGYQGGNIFPTFFIAGVVGLIITILFPFIPVPVAMMACIASAMFMFTPMPLLTIFLLSELSSFSLVPVMALSLTGAYLVMLMLGDKPQKQTLAKV